MMVSSTGQTPVDMLGAKVDRAIKVASSIRPPSGEELVCFAFFCGASLVATGSAVPVSLVALYLLSSQ